jgi:hypothetical protein
MNSMPLFSFIWQGYNSTLIQGVNNVVAHLLSAMSVELTGLLMLFVIVVGVMMTIQSLEWNRGVQYMIRAIIVAALLRGSAYNTYVVTTFMTTIPNWIASSVGTGGGATALAQQFDALHSAVEHMSAALLMQATGLLNIGTRASINLATAACEVTLVICFAIYIIAYAVMGVVVAAGVPLVASWLFNNTKHWGERWLGKLVSLSILMLFISVTLQIVMTQDAAYMRQAQANMGGDLDQQVAVLWHIFACFCIGTVVTLALPLIASAIGGSAVMSMSSVIIAPVRFGASSIGRIGSGGGATPAGVAARLRRT